MNDIIIHRTVMMIIAGLSLTVGAQTNSFSQCSRWLILPDIQLRGECTEPRAAVQPRDQIGISSSSQIVRLSGPEIERVSSTELSTDHDNHDPQWFRRVEPELILIQPKHSHENILSRGFTSIFQPEEFRVGKTTVSCSIWTAIKRKNPLCLINPIFLNVSW